MWCLWRDGPNRWFSESATVRAKTDCEVVPINEKSFLFLVHETPYFVMAVMRTLAARLRRMDEAI